MKSGATVSDAEIDCESTGRREGVLEAANSEAGRSYAASIQETERMELAGELGVAEFDKVIAGIRARREARRRG